VKWLVLECIVAVTCLYCKYCCCHSTFPQPSVECVGEGVGLRGMYLWVVCWSWGRGGAVKREPNVNQNQSRVLSKHMPLSNKALVHSAGWLVRVHSRGCACTRFLQVTSRFRVQPVEFSSPVFLVPHLSVYMMQFSQNTCMHIPVSGLVEANLHRVYSVILLHVHHQQTWWTEYFELTVGAVLSEV
jgi:hypothetical protein